MRDAGSVSRSWMTSRCFRCHALLRLTRISAGASGVRAAGGSACSVVPNHSNANRAPPDPAGSSSRSVAPELSERAEERGNRNAAALHLTDRGQHHSVDDDGVQRMLRREGTNIPSDTAPHRHARQGRRMAERTGPPSHVQPDKGGQGDAGDAMRPGPGGAGEEAGDRDPVPAGEPARRRWRESGARSRRCRR